MSGGRAPSDEVRVSVFGGSHIGRVRPENQDSLLVADLGAAPSGRVLAGGGARAAREPARFTLGPSGALLLVADGMGGAAAGGLASRLAVSAVYGDFVTYWEAAPERSEEAFALGLARALEAANGRIRAEAERDSRHEGMGTTATLAGLLGRHAYFAQVGDSRAYVVREGRAVQVTRDQSLVQDFIDAGMLTEDEARTSAHRGQVLQALGVAPVVRPHMTFHELRRDDVVLLCSDGLSRVVRDAEIAEAAARAADPADLCRRLIAEANERGGPDNVTAVVAHVSGEGLAPAEGEAVARRIYEPGPVRG